METPPRRLTNDGPLIVGAEDVQLAPCPFCGGAADLAGDVEAPFFQVVCLQEGCEVCPNTDFQDTLEAAVAVWNRRPGP